MVSVPYRYTLEKTATFPLIAFFIKDFPMEQSYFLLKY